MGRSAPCAGEAGLARSRANTRATPAPSAVWRACTPERGGAASPDEPADDRQTVPDDGQDIVAERSQPTHCCLILTGMACRYQLLLDGRRRRARLPHAGRHAQPAEPAPEGDGPCGGRPDVRPRPPSSRTGACTTGRAVSWPDAASAREALVDAAIFRECGDVSWRAGTRTSTSPMCSARWHCVEGCRACDGPLLRVADHPG